MRWGAAGGDQRGADAHGGGAGLLQPLQRGQQGFEGAGQQGLLGFVLFVLLKGAQALGLVNALGLVAEEYGVAVEGNAYFVRVGVAGVGRVGVDLGGGYAGVQRGAHVAQVGAQKQVGVQGLEVAPGRLPAREAAALNRQAVVLGRAKHAHARDRVVARQDHHFYGLVAGGCRGSAVVLGMISMVNFVKGQQLFHQRKRHAGFGRCVEPGELQLHVGAVVALLEHLVLFFKVEQGAAGNRHHQFAVQ